MKKEFLVFVLSAITLAVPTIASARVNVTIGIAPFGIGYAPPVIYQPEPYYQPYYEPAPAVYMGAGSWGDDERRGRRYHGRRGNQGRGRGGDEHR